MIAASVWQRWLRGTRYLWHRPDWSAFLGPNWLERIMAAEVTDRFHAKQGRSTGRLVLESSEHRLAVYLKRHYRLPWWRGLLAALWPGPGWSPAWQEYRHLEWARRHDLPVPAAVAVGEFVGPWGRLQSFLAVEELTGMLPLHEAIPAAAAALSAEQFETWKRGFTAELARLARGLHGRRWFHKDLYLCHFYVAAGDTQSLPDWPGRVHVIDLHRLGHHPWSWRIWQIKDLAQLLYSSEIEGVTARDRLRFWRAYLGREAHGFATAWLRRCVVFKYHRYLAHNQKRVLLPSPPYSGERDRG